MSGKPEIENLKARIAKLLRSQGVLIGLVLIIIVASILEHSFLTASNLLNILRQSSALGIVCLGVTFVMMTGGMDLSVGSIVSLCAVVAVSIMNRYGQGSNSNGTALLAILATIVIGFLVGTINGSLIVMFNGRLGETFIITYGMEIVVAAIALLYSGGQFMAGTFAPGLYEWLSSGTVPIIIFLALAAIMHVLLAHTSFGKQVSFIGANMDCARMSGIKVSGIRVLVYGMCGVCAGLASVIVTSRVYSASPLQGNGYELDAIAAVMVGGTSQTGGTGGIINTILGVLVLSVLGNALNVIGVDANAQLLFRGAIILAAVGLDVWNKNISMKEAAK
ncbi:Ribose ABC transporter permease protein [uncultured spirochete]|uniref:Ribose ABC transporter permease protein n=1 Tax=uncultured spirochete TaxID=156406 RepID=A0A3P3XR12_9SPIR|nr:Ribose ABC transporter permease protein [uncultured spirochete]